MSNEPLNRQLQNRWPETDNYLERIGQVNNDLMVEREMRAAQNHLPSFLEKLAIDVSDLLVEPDGETLLRFLHSEGIRVPSAEAHPAFVEEQAAYQEDQENPMANVLDDPNWAITFEHQAQELAALPEMHEKLLAWALRILNFYHLPPSQHLSHRQVLMLVRLWQFLNQSAAQDEWREESVRSLLSTTYFEKAANHQ